MSAIEARSHAARRQFAATLFLIGLAASLLALAVLLYHVPPRFLGNWGMYPDGATLFSPVIPFLSNLTPLPLRAFVWLFRVALLFSWFCWGGLIVLGFQGRFAPRRVTIATSIALVGALAICAPTVLSNDVLQYSGYVRLVLHDHINPYSFDRMDMFMPGPSMGIWRNASPLAYGPLWLIYALGFGALGNATQLVFALIAHKLLAGIGVLVMAFAGANLAERREAGRGPLTFIALGLNPFLLLEGPTTGHNEVVMMAMVVLGAAVYARGSRRFGALLVGFGAAIKLTGLAALPPLLLFEARRPDSRVARVLAVCILVSLPFAVCSLFFGGPFLLIRATLLQAAGGSYRVPLAGKAMVGVIALVWSWRILQRSRVLSPWLTGAIPFALAAIVTSGLSWYPWHLTSALVPVQTAWDEQHRSLNVVLSTCAIILMIFYSVS